MSITSEPHPRLKLSERDIALIREKREVIDKELAAGKERIATAFKELESAGEPTPQAQPRFGSGGNYNGPRSWARSTFLQAALRFSSARTAFVKIEEGAESEALKAFVGDILKELNKLIDDLNFRSKASVDVEYDRKYL